MKNNYKSDDLFDEDSLLEFADESELELSDGIEQENKPPWKLLIVDDDNEVHTLTKLVLSDYKYENRPLQIFSSYSRKEAFEILRSEQDLAVVLLDVVMETDDAGLNCIQDIREKLQNKAIRIILRTGQPGHAPERDIIVNYDINDYKAKTELTAEKVFTMITASLRAYSHIKTISQSRKGLENIITASKSLFEMQSFKLFAKGILTQITSILKLDKSSLLLNYSSLSAFHDYDEKDYEILACTGTFEGKEGNVINEVLPENVYNTMMKAEKNYTSIFTETTYTGCFRTRNNESQILFFEWQRNLSEIEKELIEIFATNIAVAFENISLGNEVIETQKEVIFTLSEVVEGRSKETANHIRRVSEITCLLAKKIGLSVAELELLKFAAPMHDIGKVATPDSILKKPGKLTVEEYETMKEHSTIGYNIFKNSNREMMKTAAIVAYQHHEKWNGKGYPRGLIGEEIHVYGRLVGLADVVDALASERCYKDAMPIERVIEIVNDERGQHFDPRIVDVFLDSIEEFKKILEMYP